MLVFVRTVTESVLIEDFVLTVTEINDLAIEVTLQKKTSGSISHLTLPLQQKTEICYDTLVVYLSRHGERARVGFESPSGIVVMRI